MMKHEFEKLTGQTVTDDEYNLIEDVYMNHPSIDHKTQIADIFIAGGMRVILDMKVTADIAQEIEKRIERHLKDVDNLSAELQRLRTGGRTE